MNIIEKYDKQFVYLSVVLNIMLAVQAYFLWSNPTLKDTDKIYTIAILVGFEFFMVHSGVFMAVLPKKASLFIFFPLYGLFALAINSMAEGNTILYMYLIVVFQRMRFAFLDASKGLKNKAIGIAVYAAIIWFFLIFIILFNKDKIPYLALNKEYLILSGFVNKHSIGVFTEEPHVAMAFAIVYYLFLALTEYNFTKSYIKNPKRFDDMVLK